MSGGRAAWIGVALVACAGAGWAIWRARSAPPEVEVARARVGPLAMDWSATGYVECRTAQVTAPDVGRVVAVAVGEGDAVEPGALLARLTTAADSAAVAAAVDSRRAAEAQARAALAAYAEAGPAQRAQERAAAAETAAAAARLAQARVAARSEARIAAAGLQAARAEAEAAGAVLRELEAGTRPEQVAQAAARIDSARASHTQAAAEHARARTLYREGAIALQALQRAGEASDQASAALAAALAAHEELRRGPRPEQVAAARAKREAAGRQVEAAEARLAGVDGARRRVTEAGAALRAARASKARVEAGVRRVAGLRSQWHAARARVSQDAALVRQAAAALRERTLRAPFGGHVGRRFVDPGDLASPGQPLLAVVEDGRSWVTAEVDEQDLAPVTPGARIGIHLPAYVGREFPGEVERLAPQAVPQTEVRTGARIVRVRVSLQRMAPADRRRLRPGMEVYVTGRAVLAPAVVLAPNEAVMTGRGGSFVYVVANGKARRRPVVAGYVSGPDTEIRGGLRAGERVAVAGTEGLADGARVAVRGRR